MAARAAQGGEHLAPALLGDHDRVEAPAAQVLHHASRLADAVLDPGEQLGMLVDQEFRALVASRLLVRQHREHEVARSPTASLRLQECADHHRDASFHVESAATPQVAVDDLSAKRLVRPLLVDRGDHVDVALEQERRRLAPALEPSHQVRSPGAPSRIARSRRQIRLQNALDQLDGDVLLAWRIGGVELDQVAGQLDDKAAGQAPGQSSRAPASAAGLAGVPGHDFVSPERAWRVTSPSLPERERGAMRGTI